MEHRTRRSGRKALTLFALSLVLLMVTAGARAAGTLDQKQEQVVSNYNFHNERFFQSFTAGLSGNLDQLDLHVAEFNTRTAPAPSPSIAVSIYVVSAGVPSGSALASGTVASPLPTPAEWVSVSLNPAASVTAATQYAIVIDCVDWTYDLGNLADGVAVCQWSKDGFGDSYPSGAAAASVDGGTTWIPLPDDDMTFRTYVSPADSTPPTVGCSVSPTTHWPPNHRLITVNASVTVSDGGSGANGFQLVSVTSNQADSGLATDDVPNDIQGWTTGIADTGGQVRAERYGGARVYTLTYRGFDVAGNSATCTATVTIPNKQPK